MSLYRELLMNVMMLNMNEISNIILFLFNASIIGVIAWVWIIILLDADQFGFIYEFFEKPMKKFALTRLLFKLLFVCFYCFAGQTALWFYLIFYGLHEYNPIYHIGFIGLAILTTQILNKKYG